MANYGMIRVEQIKSGAVAGRAIHNQRDYQNSNVNRPDHVNPKLEKNNLYIGEAGRLLKKPESFKQSMATIRRATEKHKEVSGRAIRSDANIATDLIFIRSDLEPELEKKFSDKEWFLNTVNWVGEKYGRENIVSGSLHRDEPDRLTGKIHPHIHILITPRDKEKRISAKRVFPLGCYRDLQTEYHEKVGIKHGLARGEMKPQKHRNVPPREFKGLTDRKAKSLKKEFPKIVKKNPDKAIEMFNGMIDKVAHYFASQDIMRERISEEYKDRYQDKLKSSENVINHLEKENDQLELKTKSLEMRIKSLESIHQAEIKELTSEKNTLRDWNKSLRDILASGDEKQIGKMIKAAREVQEQSQKSTGNMKPKKNRWGKEEDLGR